MAREAGTGVGRWREGPPGASTAPRKATATAKWGRAAFLSALFLAVLGVVVSIIYYVTMLKSPEPEFVPLWITDYQKPERLPLPSLPWLEADRKALADSKVFRKFGQAEKADLNPTREVMEERLENLKATRLDDGLVVYVSAYSRADNLGRVLLVATNSHPYEPESHFPLRRLLEKLKNCKARKKLLVLDIVRTPPDLFDLIGGAEGVADLVQKELRSNDDPAKPFDKDLSVICSCSQGQVSLWSEALQGSVFGHFFRLGLTTDAADKDKNRAVTVRELADYLAGAVDRWAYQYRGIHQQPYLFGQPPKDFVLATLSSRLAAREPAGKTKPAGEKKKPVEREAAKEELSKEQTKKEPGKTSSGDSPAPKDEASDAGQDSAEEFSYPSWLAEGWKVRNEWWTSGDYALAPRAYRRLQTALLRAEVQWRGGAPVDVIERSLRAELKELTDSMRQARDLTLPAIRSVGQARAFGQHADGESVKALVEILKQRRRPDNLLKPAEQEEKLNKAAAAFLERFKEKKSIDMAQVLVDAAAEERFDPSTLGFLDSIVGQSPFSRDLVELRFLAQLAERARQTPQEEWTDDTSKIAKLAWDTVTLAETANSRTSTFPWVRDLLEQADSLRHDAEVLLLPRTEGMASWSRIADAWTRARDAYGFLDSCQQRISQARAALAQARATLPAYLAYLETQDQAQNDGSLWFDAVDAARKLDALMARPAEGPDGAASRTSDRLRELTNQLATPAQQLQDLVTRLLGPFQPAAIRDLLGRVEKGQLDPGLGLTIEALLATPFMSAQDRQSLWKTGRRLDQRIEEALATKGERLETEPETTSRAGRDRIPSVRKIAERRAQYMAALLRLGGEETTAEQLAGGVKLAQEMKELPGVGGAEAQSESTMLTGLWMREVQMVRNVKTKMASLLNQSGRDDPDDRLGWVAPMFEVDWQTNPTRETRQREASAAWAWLAARHRQLSQDSENLEGRPDRFHDEAALEYAQLSSESAQEKTLRLVRTASAPVRIVAQRAGAPVRETVQVVLQGPAAARPAKVALVPLTVDDPRLEVKVVEPAIGELQLRADEPGQRGPPDHLERESRGDRPEHPKGLPSGGEAGGSARLSPGRPDRDHHRTGPAAIGPQQLAERAHPRGVRQLPPETAPQPAGVPHLCDQPLGQEQKCRCRAPGRRHRRRPERRQNPAAQREGHVPGRGIQVPARHLAPAQA